MSKGRLTRHELSWLLTQEAQKAAERLRRGVQVLRTGQPPERDVERADPTTHVDVSLDTLDDVVRMLSTLNQRAQPAVSVARRGRIDLATLLYEVAPEARVSIEPGGGTEVMGEELDLRRMLQVLVGHGASAGCEVTLRREGDEVRVVVALGPEGSPTTETERAWLHRMAVRYGGSHELQGGSEILVFPAEEDAPSEDRDPRRGEASSRSEVGGYARELQAMLERGDEVTTSAPPPPHSSHVAVERAHAVGRLASALARDLRTLDEPARTALVEALDLAGGLRDELASEVEILGLVREAVALEAPRLEAAGVMVRFAPEASAHASVRAGRRQLLALVRCLLVHATHATPRGGALAIGVTGAASEAAKLVIDDGGPRVAASARRALALLEGEPPSPERLAVPVHLALVLAQALPASLELGDAPEGGCRFSLQLARH